MTLASTRRFICTAAAALLVPAAAAHAQRVQGSFERTLTVGQRPDVEIESESGGIDVRQGSGDRVEVRARVTATDWGWRSGRYTAEERVKRLEANPPVAQSGNAVRIGHIEDDDVRNGVSVSYEVTV